MTFETGRGQFTNEFTEQFTEQFTINDLQKRIYSMMLANPNISTKVIASEIGITDRYVKKNIKILRELGIIERVGTTRNGSWLVKRQEVIK